MRISSLSRSFLFVAACGLSLSGLARTFTWTGAGGDGKWSTLGNWLKDGAAADRLPQGGDSVMLTTTETGASGNTIVVDVDASFDSLTFKGTQDYTLTGVQKLTTSGSWYVGAETEEASLTVAIPCQLGGKLYVGCDSGLPGVLRVADGADITATRVYVGGKDWSASNRHGWVYQSGGTVTASDSASNEAFKLGFAGGGSTGYYELTGGTLVIPVFGSVMSGSTGTFVLDGGTIKANAALAKFCEDFSNTRIHLKIGANGGTFDTNGYNINFNSFAVETGVTDGKDGGLTKTGAGTLTFGAPWQFTGDLKVEEGTVVDSDGKVYGDSEQTTVHERRLLTVGDVTRSYALYVPKTMKANPALVISLHGMYGTIYSFYKDIDGVKTKVSQEESEDEGVTAEPGDRSPFRTATADEAGCIVVYPQGLKRALYGGQNYGWLSDGANTEDVDFFKAIIEDVAARYPTLDRKRIYCCGFSNGGMMTYAAMTQASDTFAAFASISGYPLNEFHLRATGARPVPFLHIHGKEDGFVPHTKWLTIRDLMVARNGCVSTPEVTTVEGRYTKSVYAAGEGGFPYVTYEVDGMGHNDGTTHTEDGDSSLTMWNFLSLYKLDDACDRTLKLRMDSTSEARGWTATALGGGQVLSYGTKKTSGDSNVYRSVQLEKGAYTLTVKSNGIVNDRYSVRLVDVDDGSRILLSRYAKIGVDADFAFETDAYRQCRIEIVTEKTTDVITEVAVHSGTPSTGVSAVEYTALELVEIPQSGMSEDGMTKEEGDGYTGYTASGSIQVAFKMEKIDVTDCEYVVVKFAEPVPQSGWWLSFTGGTIDLPEGVSEYVFPLDASIRESGTLKESTMLTGWGAPKQQIKVAGVYKAHVKAVTKPVEMIEIPQSGMSEDGMTKEEGDGYTGYTASGAIKTAFKMTDIDITGCSSILIQFAEPVPQSGWWLAFWALSGNKTTDLPKGATEFVYTLTESEKAAGRLPQCTLLTNFSAPDKQIKVAGVYKIPVQADGDAPVPVDKGHLVRLADGGTHAAEATAQTVWERTDIRVKGCDYVLITFAEPVSAGWGLALADVDGFVRIPEGAHGYRIDLDEVTVAAGVFPKLALVALGPNLPQTIKLDGIYKHSLVRGLSTIVR